VPILSFSDEITAEFFVSGKIRQRVGWASVASIARRKLDMIYYADQLQDLFSPPGNRLEALAGNLKGWHSIRVNNQWRIIFVWTDTGAQQVRVTDYH
jgi:toxin HigB-1